MTTAFVGPHPRRCPMRKTFVFTTVTIAALVAARRQARAPISFAAAEQIRLRAHFDSVERELRARDVPGLTPAQRAARTRVLDILHRYQVRGVFPQNTDFPDRDVLGLAVGAPYAGNAGGRGMFARWDAGVGAVSLVLGIVRLATPAEPAAQSRVSVGPWFGAPGSSGLAARVTF